MARVSNPLIGKSSGSVGGVTFSSWKGINVIKAKPAVVANPQTDKQKAQRSAFTTAVAIYRVMVSVLVLGFKELAVKKSTFNAFVSVNLKKAFDLSAPPDVTLLPAMISISKGTISPVELDSCAVDTATGIATFNFSPDATLPGQSSTDKPLMALYNEDKSEWLAQVGDAARTDGSDTADIPATWESTDTVHAYLGFTNISGDQASDSDYVAASVA